GRGCATGLHRCRQPAGLAPRPSARRRRAGLRVTPSRRATTWATNSGRVRSMRRQRLWTVLVPAAAAVLGLGLALPPAGDGAGGAGAGRVLDGVRAGEFARSPLAPGISARVDVPGLHWAGAVGVADREAATPLRATDTFRIASVTKTFTAATVLSLVDRERIRLDAPIASYLPAPYPQILRDGGDDPHPIPLPPLLTHPRGPDDSRHNPAHPHARPPHPPPPGP